jgi:DNA-binding MarR family transcriptional regulator
MSRAGMPEPMAKRLGYALKRAQHAFRALMDDGLRPLDLSAAQYAVMSAVELEPGLSNATLARAAFVTPQAMQEVIANLERVGLIVRSADPSHGRILRTELTLRGRRLLAKAHEVAARVESVMVAAVGAKEAEHMATLLIRCADRLTEDFVGD